MSEPLPLPLVEEPPPQPPWLEELPPAQIVAELDRYIVGQQAAKRAVAIAIRNRWRRSQTPEAIRTEIARRLARLAGAPFIKVEASKFTEVGYVGRDAESMIRDLVDAAISMVRTEREDDVYPIAEQRADERLLDILLPPPPPKVESGVKAGAAGSESPIFVVGPAGQADNEDG